MAFFLKLGSSSNSCFSSTETLRLEEIKLIKKLGELIFFNAKLASDGMLGDYSTIRDASSRILSMVAFDSLVLVAFPSVIATMSPLK